MLGIPLAYFSDKTSNSYVAYCTYSIHSRLPAYFHGVVGLFNSHTSLWIYLPRLVSEPTFEKYRHFFSLLVFCFFIFDLFCSLLFFATFYSYRHIRSKALINSPDVSPLLNSLKVSFLCISVYCPLYSLKIWKQCSHFLSATHWSSWRIGI